MLVYVNDMNVPGGAYFAGRARGQGSHPALTADERNRKFVFHRRQL